MPDTRQHRLFVPLVVCHDYLRRRVGNLNHSGVGAWLDERAAFDRFESIPFATELSLEFSRAVSRKREGEQG